MKILITLIEHRTSDFGGALLYTKEIYQNLCKSHEVYFINGTEVITNQKIDKINYKLLSLIKFDLCIIMQSDHFLNLNLKINLNHAKIINVIHSEVFEVDAPLRIQNVKYIAVREEIKDNLIKNFDINNNLIKVLHNPINENFYTKSSYENFEYENIKYGIFACANLGAIRIKASIEFSLFCKENKLKSLLVTNMSPVAKQNMYQFYDKILDATQNINYLMSKATICGGILKGRTYWEAKLLSKPVMEYMVDSNGEIIYEIYEKSPTQQELEIIKKITHPEYVTNQIIQWAFN